MRVTTRAVRDLAREVGMPSEIIERHIDALVSFTFRIAQRERRHCVKSLREWVYSKEVAKPPILEALKPRPEEEAMDIMRDII